LAVGLGLDEGLEDEYAKAALPGFGEGVLFGFSGFFSGFFSTTLAGFAFLDFSSDGDTYCVPSERLWEYELRREFDRQFLRFVWPLGLQKIS
jgi:hypothetical protein